MATLTTGTRRIKHRHLRHIPLIGGVLLIGATAAHAQTYGTTVVNPFTTQVAQFSTTTTAGSPTFNRPAVARPGITVPTGVSGLGTAVAYFKTGFTPGLTGTYTVQTSGVTYGVDATNLSDYLQSIYQEASTVTPAGITNIVQSYNPPSATGGSYNVSLTGNTNYTFVDHGYYNAADYAANPADGPSFGNATTTILYNNPGSTSTVPDDKTTGPNTSSASQVLTVNDTTTITSFTGITIEGLQQASIGDLTATLSHNGVTVDLFDHTNASPANYNQGSQASFGSGNTYTFALSGMALSAPPDYTVAPSGTYMASGNAATGFDAANAGNTLANFFGQSVGGAWTLSLTDNEAGNGTGGNGSFTGFSFGINGAPTIPAPEPSQYAAFAIGILGLGGLSLRARRSRQALKAS